MTSDTEQDFERGLEQDFNDTLYSGFDSGYYIGMMSGTSLDGMDAVICQFDDMDSDNQDTPSNKIIATHSAAFPAYLRDVLLTLCEPNGVNRISESAHDLIDYIDTHADHLGFNSEQAPKSELEWFGWASRAYGEFASQVVNELLKKANIDAESILAIGCHGQTVRHHPNLGFSLQLVDPNVIAERTGISVVSDFRRRDMVVGGQGAPLAPAFHLAQFGTHNTKAKTRIIVNLGGIANITVLPANTSAQQTDSQQISLKQANTQHANIIGYDTGPANMLLDAWYQYQVEHSDLLTQYPTYEPLYDKAGQWAQTGQVNQPLLDALLSHPYFDLPTPKSTGRETFHLNWLDEQITQVKTETQQDISNADVQATLTALTVITLSNAIRMESKRLNLEGSHQNTQMQGDVVVCGGGAYNTYLLEQLSESLSDWNVITSEAFGISPTWVESMAFAWLARQSIMGETGNLPAVTGANKAVVLGQVCFA